jgi:hypothetical protein
MLLYLLHKTGLIIGNTPLPSLRVPTLSKHETCPAFAQSITAKNTSDVLDRSPPLRLAQKVSCAAQGRPDAASQRSVLSFNDGLGHQPAADASQSRLELLPRGGSHPRWPPVPDDHDCG